MIKKYRKKPVVIEAMLWLGKESWGTAMQFIDVEFSVDNDDNLFLPTLEGEMQATPGNWIIRGVAGEYYPCKPDIFDATYEEVTA